MSFSKEWGDWVMWHHSESREHLLNGQGHAEHKGLGKKGALLGLPTVVLRNRQAPQLPSPAAAGLAVDD